jgi:hypothetical protein
MKIFLWVDFSKGPLSLKNKDNIFTFSKASYFWFPVKVSKTLLIGLIAKQSFVFFVFWQFMQLKFIILS